MPKIQEYLPEQDAQGPVGQTSPMLEQVSMYGRGIEQFGRETGDAFNVLTQKKTAAESTDAYASVADKRAEMMQRIEDERNAGTLNDEGLEKIKTDYQDWTDKQFEQYNTTGGKNAFVRASSRSGGMILTTAAHASSVVAGNKAKEQLNTVMNQNSNLVMNDPSHFDQVRDSQTEMIQSQVDAGSLTPQDARIVREKMDGELFKGAFYGHMQSDYNNIKNAVVASGDKIDPNTAQFNHSAAWLTAGEGDKIIDADQREKLHNEIKTNQEAAQRAGQQVLAQKVKQINVAGEALKVEFNSKLSPDSKTTLQPDDVTKAARAGLIDSSEQLKYYHLIQQSDKEQLATNPAIKNSLMSRVLLPDNDPQKISDSMQVASMVKDNLISMRDWQDIDKLVRSVPANRANMHAESELMKVARQRIGTADPDSEYKLMQFQTAVQDAKHAAIKNQQPLGPLFDPNSKEFLGNKIPVATPAELLKAQADRARGVTISPRVIDTQPGVVPTPSRDISPYEAARQKAFKGMAPESNPISDAFGRLVEAGKNYFNSGGTEHKHEDIATMDLASLGKLDKANLSPAQKAVARARYNELAAKKGSAK